MTQIEQNNQEDVSGGPQIFGWCMYDWANSAYVTTVVAGVLPIYFADRDCGQRGRPDRGHRCQRRCPLGHIWSVLRRCSYFCLPLFLVPYQTFLHPRKSS